MDIIKSLQNVNSLKKYIAVTQNVKSKSNVKVQINITTILALKAIKSLEIEHLNKCGENGVACFLIERMLALPASNTWGILGKELIGLIKYWLDAIRKQLVLHSQQRWVFLKLLLTFIKEIQTKSPSIPNSLVEMTSEHLFELASKDEIDSYQRHEILHYLNIYCASASREIRFAMRNKFGDYFIKLASQMATTGFFPCQYRILESLIRWLVPRQEKSLRTVAATKWFPPDLYPQNAIKLFMDSPWISFFQDSRNFLNILNQANGLVKSFVCRQLSIGNTVVLSDGDKRQTWLDVNKTGNSVSVLLDPRLLEKIGVTDNNACEFLIFKEDIMNQARLQSVSGVTLTLQTNQPLSVCPSNIRLADNNVTIRLSTRTDLPVLDKALKEVFGPKYQVHIDMNTDVALSPSVLNTRIEQCSEEDTRFSHPVEVKKRKRSGYIVRSKNAINTPSSTSTTSLAQLHEKLAALPLYPYDKIQDQVCITPDLSNVTEHTEIDNRSLNSTLQFKPHGVQHWKVISHTPTGKAQSDSETIEKLKATKTKARILSPVVSDDGGPSFLIEAILGTADDSIINDTIERLSKSKDFDNHNIVNLLIEEAIIGTHIDEHDTENIEEIEDTPVQVRDKAKSRSNLSLRKKACTVVSKSTTDDESNTEAKKTPTYINTRSKRNATKKMSRTSDKQALDKENSETGSETKIKKNDNNNLIMKDNIEVNKEMFQFNDIDIVECLNDILEKVCIEFNKCTEIDKNIAEVQKDKGASLETKTIKAKKQAKKDTKPKTNIKINFKNTNKEKPKRVPKRKIVKKVTPKKMSVIIEHNDEDDFQMQENNSETVEYQIQSPVKLKSPEPSGTRRKRKLYSPKDDEITTNTRTIEDEDDDELSDFKTNKIKTPKRTSTCYTDIETERKETRTRRKLSKGKVEEPPSPHTAKLNEIFDKLKETTENPVILADKNDKDIGIYNYTSDEDDDEDFKKKKIEVGKRLRSNTSASAESIKPRRKPRKTRLNYSATKSTDDEAEVTKMVSRRKITKRNTKQKGNKPASDLVDERMRASNDALNTSMVFEQHKTYELNEPEPRLVQQPQMEQIAIEETIKSNTNTSLKKKNTNKKEKEKKQLKASDREDDKTVSPLPELVVETNPEPLDDVNDSITANMLQKFKRIYTHGPDNNATDTTQNLIRNESINISQPNIAEDNISEYYIDDITDIQEKTKKSIRDMKNSVKAKIDIHSPVKAFSETENILDVSITTNGITAHGDTEEEPPSPDMITQLLSPREAVDMDPTIKEYFLKLLNEINKSSSREDLETSKIIKKISEIERTHERTPVVSIQRLSINDISKSASSSNSSKSNVTKSSRDKSVSNKCIVSVKRLSEDDINKWMSPANSPDNSDSQTINKSIIRDKSIVTLPPRIDKISFEEFEKWLPIPEIPHPTSPVLQQTPKISLKSKKNKENVPDNKILKGKIYKGKTLSKYRTRSFTKKLATASKEVRKSLFISPIKDFEDCARNLPREESDEESCTNITHSKEPSKITTPNKEKTSEDKTEGTAQISSSSVLSSVKKNKPITSNAASHSTIDDWFKRTEDNFTPNIDHQYSDLFDNVMDRINTTLEEINHNTTKKYTDLFVDVQKHLDDLKEKRRIMMQKFDEMDDKIREQIKKQVFETVKADLIQKRRLVVNLKDDLKAAKEFIERQNK